MCRISKPPVPLSAEYLGEAADRVAAENDDREMVHAPVRVDGAGIDDA